MGGLLIVLVLAQRDFISYRLLIYCHQSYPKPNLNTEGFIENALLRMYLISRYMHRNISEKYHIRSIYMI